MFLFVCTCLTVVSTYLDLLNVKELTHYVNFVAHDTTPNAVTIDIIKKAIKNDTLLHQVIALARQNKYYVPEVHWQW